MQTAPQTERHSQTCGDAPSRPFARRVGECSPLASLFFKTLPTRSVGSSSVDPVAIWLVSQVAATDAYSRLVDTLRSKDNVARLEKATRKATGIRTGRRYREWLLQQQTWNDLCARQKEAYERLVSSLSSTEARRFLRDRAEDRERATKLVDATISYFLPTLDPATAIAVADQRAEDRHDELLARHDASTSFADRLDLLPPAAREVLQRDESPWETWRLLTLETRMESWHERRHQGSRRRVGIPIRRRRRRSGWCGSSARSSARITGPCIGLRSSSVTGSSRFGLGASG